MNLPLLSEAYPVASTEGTLDPLGLFPIADSLAYKLVPGVRERQVHPRFITAIAVSLSVCSAFDEDALAADGVSEPWQVFEWYMVEGLVRTHKDRRHLDRLPGIEKTTAALQDKVPLSADRYLKNPTTFGFHGVYRVLAHQLGVEVHGRPGEFGYELLTVWMKEQGLPGFYGSDQGEGSKWRRVLIDALEDALKKGCVARKGGWGGWQFFHDHLSHLAVGTTEAGTITRALRKTPTGHTSRILDFLVSREGRSLWAEEESERTFQKELAGCCGDSSLKHFLHTINRYELFARLLQDAFDDCLFEMSHTGHKTGLDLLSKLRGVKKACGRIRPLFTELTDLLAPYGETDRLNSMFSPLAENMNPDAWTAALLDHHKRVQLNKPPNGKAPWFEQFDDGACIIRPGYVHSSGGRHTEDYVHAYRTRPLWSFAADLKLI